ncbi:hypothetical protein BDV95DRAFT_492055 [Massariosphaeria phaeospora]|uniref:Uncharacterized protein n=1 Tax=Massariosphaeria phaeospora TaxID=100035 RepID=A0A7C8MB19_9PLEO|nr:hypothetical protein BDV95DRAFT_492055 [Massariosphaeria phaeospora]
MDTPEEPWAATRTPSSRPTSQKSGRSVRSARSPPSSRTTEETPLLVNDERDDDEEDTDEEPPARTSLLQSLRQSMPWLSGGKTSFWKKRWPSILALVLLFILVIIILVGFLAAERIEEYAMQAANFKPTKLALDSMTDHGVRVQVEGDFSMDASKVKKQSVRNFGRFGTWIAREAETGPTDVDVYLPEYGNILVGTAKVPGIKVNIRNGHTTHVSFFADVEPGSFDGLRNVANDWIEGRLGQIRIKGKASVPLKSGLINLSKQSIEDSIVFQGNKLPTLPQYDITKLNLREAKDGHKGMGADVSLVVTNDFPVQITLPPVAVDVLVDGCQPSDKHIMVGTAETAELRVEPQTDLEVNVTGRVEKLPDSLIKVCPDSAKSPLDSFLNNYMQGQDATIYINCCKFPDPSTPGWARDLLKDITVPVPFAGRDMGNLIKNFSMANVHFYFPEMFAEPGTPEASPKISAVVKVDIGLPKEMNFPLDVSGVKADADIYYHKKKLGRMNIDKWQQAKSTRIDAHGKEGPSLLVESDIVKAPVEILDDDLFSEVVQALILTGKPVMMDIKAAVSVGVDTPMGKFAIREIPAEGVVPVKPIGAGNGDGSGKPMGSLNVKVGNLSIIDTSPTSVTVQSLVNFTNPSNYSTTIPYFDIKFLVNGTALGHATVKDTVVHPGNNTNLRMTAVYDPFTSGGPAGKAMGQEFLSQYISRYNVSITLQTHKGSIPAQPAFGAVLSQFPYTVPFPRVSGPKPPSDGDDPDDPDKDDDSQKFIRGATMHLISSTAVFSIGSPFSSTTMYITNMNATSYYEGQPAGQITSDLPFAVPPGLSESPRLPVDWDFGSIGYGAIKKAIGGTLKLSAFAHVGIRIGQWREQVWFQGGQIGAHVRL